MAGAPPAIQMDAVGADTEEGDGAAIHLADRRRVPARRHREIFMPPGLDEAGFAELQHHLVERVGERVEAARRDEGDARLIDAEGAGKAPQRLGIVAPDMADADAVMKERQKALGAVAVAGVEMIAERHGASVAGEKAPPAR